MRKMIKIILFSALFLLLIIWGISILKCEYLTYKYKTEFTGLELETNMVQEANIIKVLSYSSDKAIVYYKEKPFRIEYEGTLSRELYASFVFEFKKINNKWERISWNCVWSNNGSADGFIWPYFR
ncbi:MAG: hypothetical protein LBQ89_09440 [Treponema sp.]|jgi:hypothetical protein|nr:hypothetical protein [Treponema sp.]